MGNRPEQVGDQDGSLIPERRLLDSVMFSQRFLCGNVLVGGKILRSGGKELALEVEESGYAGIDPAA